VIIASTAETVSTIAAVVTVGLAALTVWLTGRTLGESQKAGKENADAHAKETAETGKLLNAIIAARDATFNEGFEAFERELAVERIDALSRIADLLRDAADLARDEISAIPTWTPMPGLMMRLEVAVSLYRVLGGEADLQQPITADILEFAAHSRGKGEVRTRILSGAQDLLVRVNALARYEYETFIRLRERRVVREGLGQPDPTPPDTVSWPG
jgi:hypothetical protein